MIPADGFHERQGKAGSKQPFYFRLPSIEPMAFAGLWESWREKNAAPDSGPYRSCAITTTAAGDWVRDGHDRVPLNLRPDAYGEWLDQKNKNAAWMAKVLKTGIVKDLQRCPVSTRVNRAANNSKACLEPLE